MRCVAWRWTATTSSPCGRPRRKPSSGLGEGGGPTLIEAKTYRTVGHHEGDPVTGTYRTQEEVDQWAERDPIDLWRKRLVEDFRVVDPVGLKGIEDEIEAIVAEAIDFARRSPAPDPGSVRQHVFAEPINPAAALSARPPRQDANARLAGSGARRHRRRDAGQSGHPVSRRGNRRARGLLRPHQGAVGTSSGRSEWSTRRSPSRASRPPRSAPRRPVRARSPT